MRTLKKCGWEYALLAVVAVCPAFAQMTSSPSPGAPGQHFRQQPCWRQAGLSSSVLPQLRQIQESTHSGIQSVCGDSSLSPQQKQEKVRQLRQESHQQIEGLMSAQQLEALQSCREQQRGGMGGGTHQGNPCAAMATNTPSAAPQKP